MAVRILCIDDHDDSIVITKRVLQHAKDAYQVDAAHDGSEGLRKLRAQPYDLILCDYRLPGMSGVDLLNQLNAEGRGTPVIIATAAGNERVAVEAMQVGAYDYVVKDALYEQILPGVIQRALARYRDRRERDEAVQSLQREKAELQRMNGI